MSDDTRSLQHMGYLIFVNCLVSSGDVLSHLLNIAGHCNIFFILIASNVGLGVWLASEQLAELNHARRLGAHSLIARLGTKLSSYYSSNWLV